jgi:hypothetical protein
MDDAFVFVLRWLGLPFQLCPQFGSLFCWGFGVQDYAMPVQLLLAVRFASF